MDRRELKRLRDEVDRGTLNVGINKLEEGALERENRSPILKGSAVGFGIGLSLGAAYAPFDRSPLGLFVDDYMLVQFAIVIGVTALGALIAWKLDKIIPRRRKPPKGNAPSGANEER